MTWTRRQSDSKQLKSAFASGSLVSRAFALSYTSCVLRSPSGIERPAVRVPALPVTLSSPHACVSHSHWHASWP